MTETLFLTLAAVLFGLFILLGWRLLPGDRFQVLASLPVHSTGANRWQGCNLTWYGALLATGAVTGVLFVLLLTAAGGSPPAATAAVLLALLTLCLPASRLVARLVENKRHTFTIGGAFFCGLVAAPLVIVLVNRVVAHLHLPLLDPWLLLAALAVGGVLGEGLGRLACISFGCCYGRPLDECGPLCRTLLRPVAFVFSAPTRKAVYEGGLAGVRLVPVQGLSAVVLTATALFGCHLFFQGRFRTAFLCCVLVSQAWRVVAERLRADFRGVTIVSAYERMAVVAIVGAVGLGLLLPVQLAGPVAIGRGLTLLSDPVVLMGLQLLWWLLFVLFGRSTVTGVSLAFAVRRERI